MADESKRAAVVAAFLSNLALTVLKALAAWFTGSAAMLAETLHSIADMGNEALLYLGTMLARRPPDERHPLGHGRDTYFWAFVVSVMLFSIGGGFAIWEAVQTFRHPAPHESYAWAYGVLVAALVFESASLAVGLRSFVIEKRSRPLGAYLRDLRDPTVLVVVLEDSAAIVSIVIAATGLGLAQWTGGSVWDGVASLLIGILLVCVAVFLAFDNYSLLLGETASEQTTALIYSVVAEERAARAVVSLRTLHIGPQALFVAIGVSFRDELHTQEIEAAVTRLKDRIARALDGLTRPQLIVIEPTRADTAAAVTSIESSGAREALAQPAAKRS